MDKNRERLEFLNTVMDMHKKRMGRRLRETRKLFNETIVIGDLHTHSFHSDGTCEVVELKKYADTADLDFMFVTDHDTLSQRDDCAVLDHVWLGQEPVCGPYYQHIGLLRPESVFEPGQKSFAEDWQAANNIAPFVWNAHPIGWAPDYWYPEEGLKQLFTIEGDFALEILNGVYKATDVYDEWQAESIKLWDRLLLSGKKITAVAGSDAHFAGGVGCAWTGVFGAENSDESVIEALNGGRTIVSEAPILLLTGGETYPGGTIAAVENQEINFKLRAADSFGLSEVRLIKDGKIIQSFETKGQQLFEEEVSVKAASVSSYYRLECVSIDYKHAFTTPIYVEA